MMGVGPPRFPHRLGVQTRTWSPQNIASIRREGMTVGSHPSPTAPEADIKTFPSPPPPPPTTERMGGYIEERVFGNFQNFREPRFKMSEPGFWVFSPSLGKGVNTWTNNLRVHTVGSDTRTMLVETTARLGWLEWRSHGCPKVTGTTSYNLFIKYFILNITKT
jgi:hypothetical protein